MSVKESANKLAGEIRNSKEYREFSKSMNEIKQDKKCERLLNEYKKYQLQIQSYSMRNIAIDKKVKIKMESIQNEIRNNKKVYDYLNSEQKFTKMMDSINKILAESMKNDYK